MRRCWWLIAVAALVAVVDGPSARGWGGYGNGGSGPGFAGVPVTAQHCGDGWFSQGGVCGPWWSGGCNTVCGPGAGPGFWFGFPGFGFGGCYGSTRAIGAESVYLPVPNGGTANFFSGRLVPFVAAYEWHEFPVYGYPVYGYPVYGYPVYGTPTFGYPGWTYPAYGPVIAPRRLGFVPRYHHPRGLRPHFGANVPAAEAGNAAPAARPLVASRQPPAPRPSNASARSRAAKFVAGGDRRLRDAEGGVARLEGALGLYRQAAAAVQDDPDIHVRQALALVALGRFEQAGAALDRAVAIDGRLAAAPPNRVAGPPDPVFGDRPAGSRSPLADRGRAILDEIAAQAGGDAAATESLARLARRWSDRWPDGLGAVAASAVPGR